MRTAKRFVRDESGMTLALAMMMILIMGVMGAGLLTFVGKDLNAVVEARTSLSARELLDTCHRVERSLGRRRVVRWGPRTIDIDILTYGRERIEEPDLVIPHPRMHERGFVLAPLLELDADPPLPAGVRLDSTRLAPGALVGIRVAAPPLVSSSREAP